MFLKILWGPAILFRRESNTGAFPVKLETFLMALFTEYFRCCFWNYCSFFTLKCAFVSKRRDVKNWLIRCWQTRYSFLLRLKNMLVLLKWTWHLHYSKSTATVVCNFYLLKHFTFINTIFYLINRFCLHVYFFLCLFNPFRFRDNPPLVLVSIYNCSI